MMPILYFLAILSSIFPSQNIENYCPKSLAGTFLSQALPVFHLWQASLVFVTHVTQARFTLT